MKNRFRILLPLASFAAALTSLPAAAAGKEELVEIDTTLGNIVVRLAPDRAPITVKNFLTYVREGFYKDTIFHRVIPGFMIQGGGFTEQLREKPTHDPIPHSATSQFYINVADNDFLNADQASDGNGYCVFGTVVKGADVVDKIAAVRTTTRRGMNDVPVDVVKIVDVKVLP